MASNVICGGCGGTLEDPWSACRGCGARPQWMAPPRSRKSPALAAALEIVPGLGHVYVGDYRRGAALMAGAGFLQFFGFDFDLTALGAVIGVPMELGGAGLWLFGIVDAYRAARRHNQQL